MRRAVVVAALAGTFAAAGKTLAQIGTADMTWQAFDARAGQWVSGSFRTTGPSVNVRLLASWSPDAGIAFAWTQFDVALHGTSPADVVSDAERTWPFFEGTNQDIVVSRFGNAVKIDDSRDTFEPGAGTRGVVSGQSPLQFADGRTSTENPAVIFEFTLGLDGPSTRLVRSLHVPLVDDPAKFVRIYTNTMGALNRPLMTVSPLEIVVPCRSDFNEDGTVDFFDYLDFVAAFAAEDPAADFDRNGQIDFFDYLDFIAAFDAECQ